MSSPADNAHDRNPAESQAYDKSSPNADLVALIATLMPEAQKLEIEKAALWRTASRHWGEFCTIRAELEQAVSLTTSSGTP